MVLIMNFLEQNGNVFHSVNSLGREALGHGGTRLFFFFFDLSEWCCILIFEKDNNGSLIQNSVLNGLEGFRGTLFSPKQASLSFLTCLLVSQ